MTTAIHPAIGPAGFSVTVTGGANDPVTLQVTSGFDGWKDVVSVTLDGSGSGVLTDVAAANRVAGFYRVIRP